MLQSLKNIFCILILVIALPQARAFSLLGEFDDWEIPEVGQGPSFGFIGGSKSLGEEFRLNTPTITYGFDSTFLDFFGPEGVTAVNQAFAILNKIPPVSKMSSNLSEFLLDDAQRIRPTPETLNLLDLKSYTLGLMIEFMGLSGEEHVFDLRKRVPFTSPIACQFDYQVVMRNFDPVTTSLYPPATRDVNGVSYGYIIVDDCPVRQVAFAIETLVDPTDIYYNSVASFVGGGGGGARGGGLQYGGYYINISRDDAGGLRYMYRPNNYNNEVLPTDVVAVPFFGPWVPVDIGGTNGSSTNIISTNTLALRGGINKVSYRKVRFDSGFGTFFKPILQTYKLPLRTNDTTKSQTARRVITQPDILFTAADLNNLPGANPRLFPATASRTGSPRYLTNNAPVFSSPTSIGPGTVIPQTVITFHKALPFFFNSTPFFLDNLTADTSPDTTRSFMWASFDGSTNNPVIYPPGTSLEEITRQALLGIP